jgi:hypothetical protein
MPDEPEIKRYVLHAEAGVFSITGSDANLVVIPYPQRLLGVAQELIKNGEYSISIVVAHIACEVAVDRVFAAAFKAKGIEYLEEAVEDLLPGNNLSNNKIRKLYTALTGDEIEKQPFWSRFCKSVTRRNEVSHNGATYEKPDAEASLAVAKEVVAHLKQ